MLAKMILNAILQFFLETLFILCVRLFIQFIENESKGT